MNSYLNIAIEAAIEAGKEILKVYETDFSVLTKDDNSPLTLADKNANAVINRYLLDTQSPIISEENKQIDYVDRKDWESCWIVDPLDGTKEFVKKNGEFTVNIAWVRHGIPELGVIYVPVSGMLYFASKAMGAAYQKKVNEGETVASIVHGAQKLFPAKLTEPYRIVGSRSHLNEDTQRYIQEMEKEHLVEMVSIGSSLKFCLVAEGKAHIYPRFAPTMEWDTAAGQAICETAGIQVIDQNTQKPLLYNKENLLNPHFLVSVI